MGQETSIVIGILFTCSSKLAFAFMSKRSDLATGSTSNFNHSKSEINGHSTDRRANTRASRNQSVEQCFRHWHHNFTDTSESFPCKAFSLSLLVGFSFPQINVLQSSDGIYVSLKEHFCFTLNLPSTPFTDGVELLYSGTVFACSVSPLQLKFDFRGGTSMNH